MVYKGEDALAAAEAKLDNVRASVIAPPADYVPPEEGVVDEAKPKKPHRNQFNFSERAAQTVNNPYRVSS